MTCPRLNGRRVMRRLERCKRGHRDWTLVQDPRAAGELARACDVCRRARNREAQRRYRAKNLERIRERDRARRRDAA